MADKAAVALTAFDVTGGPSASPIRRVFSPCPSQTAVDALALDPITPSILYAGTLDAGAFKSTDTGAHWTASSTNLIATSMFVVAINPLNRGTLYAGIGRGGGVIQSTDGATSWSAANNTLPITPLPAFNTLAFDRSSPSRLYAGTNNGLYQSTDGAATWSLVGTGSGLPTGINVHALAFDQNNPITLYAGTTTGVYTSTSAGTTWSQLNLGLADTRVVALAINPTTSSFLDLSTQGGGVFRSGNGGALWSPLSSSGLTNASVDSLVVDPGNPQNIYAGTIGGGAFVITDTSPLPSVLYLPVVGK